MARRKNSPSVLGEQMAKQILDNYDLKNAQDVQETMKQIFGPIFESMLILMHCSRLRLRKNLFFCTIFIEMRKY